MREGLSAVILVISGLAASAAPPAPGYHTRLNVSAPTQLDWTFVLSNRSLTKLPNGWLPADLRCSRQPGRQGSGAAVADPGKDGQVSRSHHRAGERRGVSPRRLKPAPAG